MRTLYLDCGMGAAGDMLTAALLELLPAPESFLAGLNALGIPGVRFVVEKSIKCGISGTHMTVSANGEEEEAGADLPCKTMAHGQNPTHHHEENHDHPHSHEPESGHPHDHDHHHCHRSMAEIKAIITALPLSEKVRADVLAVYALIAQAESKAHGLPVSEIHFHEVGTMDAIADITAVCLLMERLAPARVVVSPVRVGFGQVRCAHGVLPVPAPATAHILRGVPVYSGGMAGEFCTPTGAALLKHFATEFGAMPVMQVETIGYGMGKKDFEAANCVRALLGSTAETGDTVAELRCNVDDMTPEELGFAMEQLFAAGALEVYTVPVGMKKSRPGVLLCVMCRQPDKDKLIRLVFKHTTTIGVRETESRRHTLAREILTRETPDGPVRQKKSTGYGVARTKYEFDDLARLARAKDISLREAARLLDAMN